MDITEAVGRIKNNIVRWYRQVTGRGWTREDLFRVLGRVQQQGLIEQDTLDTIERVVQVSELRVRDIMIPSARMVVVYKNQSPEEILPLIISSAHSRFPVIDSDRDKVIGILLAKDLLRFFDDPEESFSWRDMLRPAVLIPESKRLNVLLKEFRANRNHMAIVVDEYGGAAGFVTIEDVLEQIVGEIEDEHDIDEEAGQVMSRGQNEYVVKAVIEIEDFNELVGADLDENENHTLGGAVVNQFGYVPQRGESVEFKDLRFEILNADSRRVHLIRVQRLTEEDQAESGDHG
ncbi:MAG: cation transporter [marine bacterium B5-7]|nr:MAG: cation transporter [marine bacterium B5-7]